MLSSHALLLADEDSTAEATLLALAHEAAVLIRARVRRGEPAGPVVAEVIQVVFGNDDDHTDGPPPVPRLLRDRAELDRVVAAVLAIVADEPPGRLPG